MSIPPAPASQAAPMDPLPIADIRSGGSTSEFARRIRALGSALAPVAAEERIAQTAPTDTIDLNPHQVEAAAFALEALERGGAILADEVGLGKTIEAGLVMSQLWSEGRRKILVLVPSSLRGQWATELVEKFQLPCTLLDAKNIHSLSQLARSGGAIICSIPFAALHSEAFQTIPWNVVVIDEAHRLRSSYRTNHKTGQALRRALAGRPKLLLTATPLQNTLFDVYGLVSFIDEQIFGSEDAFRVQFLADATDGSLSNAATGELKRRLSGVVHRTLRHQVREYVRFTKRRSMVEDFAPSAEEQALYDDVSDYLSSSKAIALGDGRRTLLLLVVRKLLASSTYAIAQTLEKLAATLHERLQKAGSSRALSEWLDSLVEDAALDEERESWSDDDDARTPQEIVLQEAKQLEDLAARARAIVVNAKGEALKRALNRVFTVAQAHQWPQKAVVFTESRRTLEYLEQLLRADGYDNGIVTFTGDASTPAERLAIVERFRSSGVILLATEAGAEGLNLQFCNVVVNYDLPWNPQRVEQRIGRCHRYGQPRDVLVLNFLNRANAAEERLYELLDRKLGLFDGVFGASDEILGALESGVDFERRVLNVYQSCRSREEVDAAFAALQSELDAAVGQRMSTVRSLIFERFDADVRTKLRLTSINGARARRTMSPALEMTASSPRGGPPTESANAAPLRVAIDGSSLPAPMSWCLGRQAWWFVVVWESRGAIESSELGHLVFVDRDGRYQALSDAEVADLIRSPMHDEAIRLPSLPPIAHAYEQGRQAAVVAKQHQLESATLLRADAAIENLTANAEASLAATKRRVEDAKRSWEAARAALCTATETDGRTTLRQARDQAERHYDRLRSELRDEEDRVRIHRDKAAAAYLEKARVTCTPRLVCSACVWIDGTPAAKHRQQKTKVGNANLSE